MNKMTFKYGVHIPISRFRREINSWIRFIDKNPDNTIYITKNNKVISVVVSPMYYEKLTDEHDQLFRRITSNVSRDAADALFSASEEDLNNTYV